MIERVLAISIRTGLLDLIIFLNGISSYCGTFGTKLLKSRLWNCKIRTLDWTIEHAITEFLSIERNRARMLSSCLRHGKFIQLARN